MNKGWILALLLFVMPSSATVAAGQNGTGEITHTPIIKRGVSYLQNAPAAPLASMKPPREADRERDLVKAMRRSMRGAAPNTILERAQASANANVINGGTAVTFNGLDIVDQEFDNRFDLEPPDQGVCAGNGLIIEHINLVLAVYTQSGSRVAGPVPSNLFFGVPRDFLADPRCYFDPGTSRWFMTITDVASVDIIPGRSFVIGAVSFDANPLDGFALFAIDVTDDGLDGTPSHPGCASGCFGDQPLLGADDNGIYITTNEFGVFTPTFNGAQIDELSDTNDLLGPFLEVIMEGHYTWIPWDSLQLLSLPEPKYLRDMVWAPATLALHSGAHGEVLVFSLYVDSHLQSDDLKLGRRTIWPVNRGEFTLAYGQKVIASGETDCPILQVRTLEVAACP